MPLFARAQSSPLPVPAPSKSPTTHPNVDGIPTALAHSSRCTADLYRNNRGGLGSTGIEMWSPFTCYASSTHPLLAGGGRGYPAIGVWTPCRNSHPAFCPQLSTQSFPNPQFNSTLLFPKSWATQNFDNATIWLKLNELKPIWKWSFVTSFYQICSSFYFSCQFDI